MLSLDLDNLNFLVLLILAFFSFKAYNPNNTLAIESQPEENNAHEQTISQNNQLEMEKENQDNVDPESVQVQNIQDQQGQMRIQVNILNSDEVTNENVFKTQIQRKELNNINVEMKSQAEKSFDVDSIEKDEEPDSTIIIRDSILQSDLYLNNLEEESSDSQVGSESSLSSVHDVSQQADGLNRRQKRKQIKKAKRKAKRMNKKQTEPQVQLVEL